MTEREIKALVSLLDDPDVEVLQHVESKILSLGEVVIPFLENKWEESLDPDLQRKIEEMLHQLQFENLKIKLINWKKDGGRNLLEGMWLVALFQYPDLKLEFLKAEINQIYFESWLAFRSELHPFDQIKVLNSIFFGNFRFKANTRNFHAPANSMINMVLESRRGNPISLAVIYMLIARKLEMPIYGINLPNIFVLTYKTKEFQFYINPFNRGLIFTREDIDNYLKQISVNPSPTFYEPCSHLQIVK
ncbi:transglutaminase-like domain-containing protein, partial [Xanthovirga aplysinae]|uniref:transglutaminase-like domain-containing protein n=1 Tax=Xanthovirga aplysinae TaxID=2529853 RepID=UPI0012BD5551